VPKKVQQPQKASQTTTQQRAPTAPGKVGDKATPAPPPPPAGLYGNLGMRDETKEFGALASKDRTQDVNGVIVHRTESPTMESTRNSYRTQIKNGNHVGAHYLVGKEGETSLTVPTDKMPAHVRGNKEDDWKGANAWALGIENVGMPSKLDRNGDLRKQVEGLNLPPAMRARLLALDDRKLKQALSDTAHEIHTDITGPQKRANWNLISVLAKEHKLDIGTDVQAHEDVDYKTLGEGEPIKEFLTAMQSYPARVSAAEAKLAALEADPKVGPAQLEAFRSLVASEKATQAALAADKTPAENNALEAEKILGMPGEAGAREADRVSFYNDFWKRSQALDKAVAPTT
jgi:N-acetyl-anhydromuramyl-L-alanine amidase AmpD